MTCRDTQGAVAGGSHQYDYEIPRLDSSLLIPTTLLGKRRKCLHVTNFFFMTQEDEEEDVRSYWMTLRRGEDILI